MALGRADLHPGNEKEPRRQFLAPQIFMSAAGVMIRNRNSAQPTLPRTRDQLLRRVAGILGKKRMHVEIEAMNHN